jgi:transmembrane sensor
VTDAPAQSDELRPRRSARIEALEEQAAEWLLRRHFSNWSGADQKELDAWLAASPSNRVTYWRLNAALTRTDRLKALRQPMRQAPSGIQNPWPKRARAVAAVALIAVGAAGGFHYLTQSKDRVISTVIGEHKLVTLADGSSIELNTSSTVRIRQDRDRRAVTLVKGEAFFDVHHDAQHPFTVDAAGQRITDLGTKFVVRDLNDRVEVALLEGRAHVAPLGDTSKSRQADLLPGDIATATKRSLSIIKASSQTIAEKLSWRSGLLVFHNTALREVARQFNRYNNGKLIIEGAAADLQVDGTFPADDPQTFTKIAGDLLHLRVERRGNDIVLSR